MWELRSRLVDMSPLTVHVRFVWQISPTSLRPVSGVRRCEGETGNLIFQILFWKWSLLIFISSFYSSPDIKLLLMISQPLFKHSLVWPFDVRTIKVIEYSFWNNFCKACLTRTINIWHCRKSNYRLSWFPTISVYIIEASDKTSSLSSFSEQLLSGVLVS